MSAQQPGYYPAQQQPIIVPQQPSAPPAGHPPAAYQHQQQAFIQQPLPQQNVVYTAPQQGAVHPQPMVQMQGPAVTYVQQPGPPQQYYAPAQQQVITKPMVQGAVASGPLAVMTTCMYCNEQTTTKVTSSYKSEAFVWAIVLFIFTGCLCFIPFLMDSMKIHTHTCGRCNQVLGSG